MWYLEYDETPYRGAAKFPGKQQREIPKRNSPLDHDPALRDAMAMIEALKEEKDYWEGKYLNFQLVWRENIP